MESTAAKKNSQIDDINNMSFEEAMNELEQIVRNLENGKIPLEEAIITYERGAAIRTHCEKKLQEAKLKVDKITTDQNQELKPTSFEESSS